jgi:hypothetical protein
MKRAAIKAMPSQEALLGLFHYAPETGVLTWKRRAGNGKTAQGFNNKCAGKMAGTVSKAKGNSAYVMVAIRDPLLGNKIYLAHRLIWKLMTGDEPPEQVDHIDGVRVNNRWANLRAADNSKNMMNTAPRSGSGFKGVYHRAQNSRSPWVAKVACGGRVHHIGAFATPDGAAAARHEAALRLQGAFARTFA